MTRARAASPRPKRAATSARRVALEALERIDAGGAYANLVVPRLLDRSPLAPRDRRFVTELAYGTTRMRRACDFLIDRFLSHPPVSRVRNVLRLGAYQLAFGEVPAHAAVAETVGLAPRSARGLVNAVLRRLAAEVSSGQPPPWPDDATRLSVPDWILDQLVADLGHEPAIAALEAMNQPPPVTERADSYVQDVASQQVAAAVGARPDERVLDACAAPGGKATALAAAGAHVVAADIRETRLGLVRANAERLGRLDSLSLVVADAAAPPWRAESFDRVLVDAPCSGLGTLGRRADLRWRVAPSAVNRLAELQRRLVAAAVDLVRPGGVLVYSVCTLTRAESLGVDEMLAEAHPELVPLAPLGEPWQPWGRGAILLPQAAGSDGMTVLRYQRHL